MPRPCHIMYHGQDNRFDAAEACECRTITKKMNTKVNFICIILAFKARATRSRERRRYNGGKGKRKGCTLGVTIRLLLSTACCVALKGRVAAYDSFDWGLQWQRQRWMHCTTTVLPARPALLPSNDDALQVENKWSMVGALPLQMPLTMRYKWGRTEAVSGSRLVMVGPYNPITRDIVRDKEKRIKTRGE